ncbi:hypothetical protein COW94_05190 [Candidatus Peregrinibacteria bacterium CG22_combo_CG10-13_8_21_14_all_44_10]|nr:MAG: hypothetical protein COW94_05190 [Candidatus Peregrinibacteria bacterium CG22_combo_CG10-13_8_21_14_all_44_10]PIS03646.1 MAG: hypothetical protein COT83_04930 [Candidatus Peregrinibacteria bacterium CG10_big_fil_rev_8_21_14_0_10_44_7]PIX80148.1 MAG: hypothetical protein COZ35_01715 [Candidatus Peregrinibacteria bacterium CG_4_10_14_3_um_filter_44_21]PJB88778.1 MAG: hypothetical protein CO082_03415 [Candidatus Peregrinibacteria bacterium CG_4_9_14_0_8_um_filter_44_15]
MMKKIIQRTRRFEKSFVKLNEKTRKLFIKKLSKFIDDELDSSLNTHRLKGKRKNEFSFSVTGDIRAIYQKEIRKDVETIIFTFVDIGTHNRVY